MNIAVRRGRLAGDVELVLRVPSDLAFVSEAVELVALHTPAGILSPRRVQFNLRTVLAEALANAITYGNREDPTKHVEVRVDARSDGIRVTVTDAGEGFDPSSVPDPTAPETLEREDGRGLFVIRHLVDAVDFNAKGNAVCLTLRAG
ncbi:MAG TPA: ATP-binding protein [Gemmatimonadales bacterium]|nr:ATP-binding protein [Gemmatimonadales bacterium]